MKSRYILASGHGRCYRTGKYERHLSTDMVTNIVSGCIIRAADDDVLKMVARTTVIVANMLMRLFVMLYFQF